MSADPATVAAARQVLAHLGVTLADLQSNAGMSLPTVAEYLPRVLAAAGPGVSTANQIWLWHELGDRCSLMSVGEEDSAA